MVVAPARIRRLAPRTPACVLAVILVVTGCGPQPSPSGTTPTAVPSSAAPTETTLVSPSPPASPSDSTVTPSPTPPEGTVVLFDNSDVSCAIGRAWAGDRLESPIPALPQCGSPAPPTRRVSAGGLVVTDACGQATVTSACGTIYVFHDSTLTFSRCDRQTAVTGNACLADGAIAWDNTCSGDRAAIATPSASLTLSGTWMSAVYLAERDLALFAVLDGEGGATAIDEQGAPVDDRDAVRKGEFWFSSPGSDPPRVAGLEPRTAYAMEDLPRVARELRLDTWFAAIRRQAEASRVDIGVIPDIPAINLRGRGGPLDDRRVQDAVLLTTDWFDIVNELFPNGEGRIVSLIGSEGPPFDIRDMETDVERAQQLLKDAGAEGFSVTVIADDAPGLGALVDFYSGTLEDIGLSADVRILDTAGAVEVYGELVERGEPTLWFATH